MIEINVIALVDLTQKAIRHMKSRGRGRFCKFLVLGFIGLRDSAVYVASKHAVNGLVKSLHYELWGTGVRIGPRVRAGPRANSAGSPWEIRPVE